MRKLRWLCMSLGTMIGFVFMAGCGTSAVVAVQPGTFRALVPTQEQLASDRAADLPGGFSLLRESGVDMVELQVSESNVTLLTDGIEAAVWPITDRKEVRDAEGSGPFKATKEVLVLGVSPLIAGELIIEQPVIWPGSFEGSPVVTLKQWDPNERGPGVTCRADENCLLFSADVAATGSYEDANNPDLGQNPIATIEISDSVIEFLLDNGDRHSIDAAAQSLTAACGLSETSLWGAPSELGLAMTDPVLIHTECPTTPGEAIVLTIMEREAIPLLAPLSSASGGEWCDASSQCLLFAPL